MKEKLKEWYRSEKEKMSGMDRKKKGEYILAYYKGWFIFAAVLIAACILIPYHISAQTDIKFNCAVVNGVFDSRDEDISDRLSQYLGFASKKERAYFDTQYQISYEGVNNPAGEASFFEKFFLNIRGGNMDAAIMPLSFMEYCNDPDLIFYDLNEVLSKEQLEKYMERIIMDMDENGNSRACGIDVSSLPIWEKENFSFVGEGNIGEKIILAFPDTGENKEFCQKFLRFLEEK